MHFLCIKRIKHYALFSMSPPYVIVTSERPHSQESCIRRRRQSEPRYRSFGPYFFILFVILFLYFLYLLFNVTIQQLNAECGISSDPLFKNDRLLSCSLELFLNCSYYDSSRCRILELCTEKWSSGQLLYQLV